MTPNNAVKRNNQKLHRGEAKSTYAARTEMVLKSIKKIISITEQMNTANKNNCKDQKLRKQKLQLKNYMVVLKRNQMNAASE